jgi:hypothetical protein
VSWLNSNTPIRSASKGRPRHRRGLKSQGRTIVDRFFGETTLELRSLPSPSIARMDALPKLRSPKCLFRSSGFCFDFSVCAAL